MMSSIHRRADDGLHWQPDSIRMQTYIILTHICTSRELQLPVNGQDLHIKEAQGKATSTSQGYKNLLSEGVNSLLCDELKSVQNAKVFNDIDKIIQENENLEPNNNWITEFIPNKKFLTDNPNATNQKVPEVQNHEIPFYNPGLCYNPWKRSNFVPRVQNNPAPFDFSNPSNQNFGPRFLNNPGRFNNPNPSNQNFTPRVPNNPVRFNNQNPSNQTFRPRFHNPWNHPSQNNYTPFNNSADPWNHPNQNNPIPCNNNLDPWSQNFAPRFMNNNRFPSNTVWNQPRMSFNNNNTNPWKPQQRKFVKAKRQKNKKNASSNNPQ